MINVTVLTHIVKAIRLSGLVTQEWHICPLAVAIGVTLNQVIRRLPVSYPVTQELSYTTGMNDSIPNPRRSKISQAKIMT